MSAGVHTGAWRIIVGDPHSRVRESLLYLGGNAEAAMELYRDTVDPAGQVRILGVDLEVEVVISPTLGETAFGSTLRAISDVANGYRPPPQGMSALEYVHQLAEERLR